MVAHAEVLRVFWSKAGLMPGAILEIRFTPRPAKPQPETGKRQNVGGSMSGPTLTEGKTSCAFLNQRADGSFSLGASTRSFPSVCPK